MGSKKDSPKSVPGWDEAIKGHDADWKKARTAKDEGNEIPEIPDGVYVSRIASARTGVFPAKGAGKNAKPAVPFMRLGFVISRGEHEGLQPFTFYRATTQQQMEFMAKQVSRLGYDLSELELKDWPDLATEIAKEKGEIRIQIKNEEYQGDPRQNVYINGLADAE